MEDLFMILSWVIFYSLHTLLASTKLKRILEAKWPGKMKRYRLFYSTLFSLLFTGILVQGLFLPSRILFPATPYLTYLGYMLAALGVIIGSRSMKEISFSSFLGLYKASDNAPDRLVDHGIYSWIRHPLYLGLVLIFLGYFIVSGSSGALIHLLCLISYLPVGIYFEEKNLLEKYGSAYEDYRRKVSALLPLKIKKEH